MAQTGGQDVPIRKLRGRRLRRLMARSRHIGFTPQVVLRRMIFWIGALAVGLCAIGFAAGANYANHLYHQLIDVTQLVPFVILPAGLALVAWLTRRFFPGSQGSGIPQAIAALQMRDEEQRRSVLSLKLAFGKIVLTLLGLFAGASVGREGPTVQVGASIMLALGRWVRFPRIELERGLILAGGAAGIAAAFNTPLAGIMFAIEEMSRSFEERTSGTVLTAVIVAGLLSLAVLGNYLYFGHSAATLGSPHEWIAVPVTGIVCGLLGGIFSRILIETSRGLPGAAGRFAREKPLWFAAVCGLVLAVVGLASGSHTYGTGYFEARTIVEGSHALPQTYGVFKMLATIVSYVSGIPGGIFSPSLAVGAGFGQNLAALMPGIPTGAVVLLSMAAYFGGVVQAPITAFVIVIEMTASSSMVLPLMASALIGSGASRLICPTPVYKAMAEAFLARPAHAAKAQAPSQHIP